MISGIRPVSTQRDLLRMKLQIQTGTDTDFQDVSSGLGNPHFAQASSLRILHRQVDHAREDVFGVKTHSC